MREKALLNDNWGAHCFGVLRPFAPGVRERSLFRDCCCFGRLMSTQGKGTHRLANLSPFSEPADLQLSVSWLADAVNAPHESLTEFSYIDAEKDRVDTLETILDEVHKSGGAKKIVTSTVSI